MKTLFFSLLLSSSLYALDPQALEEVRANAQRLTQQDIVEIIHDESMQTCMKEVFKQAKYYDRRRGNLEVAVWVHEEISGGYACTFWPESSRVPGGFDWDGTLPRRTLFSLHSHPKNSGGIRPSESDYEFNSQLGMIGLVFSHHTQKIGISYPGSKRYHTLFNRSAFRRLKRALGL